MYTYSSYTLSINLLYTVLAYCISTVLNKTTTNWLAIVIKSGVNTIHQGH